MPIKVTCDNCGVTLKTADSAAGKKAKCPKCQAPIVVPMPSVDPEPLEAEPLPSDDWGDFDQEAEIAAAAGAAAGAGDGEERKPCPACGEMIVAGAAKCRYCGEFFDAKLAKSAKRKNGGDAEKLSVIDWIVAILCPLLGCIVAIIYSVNNNPKSGKMFKVVGIVMLISFTINILLAMLGAVVEAQ